MSAARLRIVDPGVFSTIQDLGRPRFQHIGVPVSGALDTFSLRIGNALVGNQQNTAAIEMCYAGPDIEILAGTVRILIAGPCSARILGTSGRELPPWRSERLEPGDILQVGAIKGACAYLTIEGGTALAPVLGSLSTYPRAGLGGFRGRRLQTGDEVPLALASAPVRDELQLEASPPDDSGPIRVTFGPHDSHFTREALRSLVNEEYVVSQEADRVGLRLEGPRLKHSGPSDIPSEGTVHGSIQVPGSGQPIVLLSDRQTTGGYPKIATVISADLPRVGRLVPGDRIRFATVTPREGVALVRAREELLRSTVSSARPVRRAPAIDSSSLLATNIIGGVVSARD